MNKDIEQIKGQCHCGTVQFEVRLTNGLHSARRCNCSYCRMRGAVVVSAQLQDLKITSGEQALTLYQFNTKVARHWFCSICGIYTHHQRRSSPDQYGINAACLDGISPFDFENVPVNDGVRHPMDHKERPGDGLIGTLKFVPSGE
ncbi:MAG: GFA family protein [Pseudomonas sp.]|jgi:hypothetical protein|uniref:GFA family protein n=1 Tax=Pseudomonas sp. TaxID=306 RepID=UPI002394299C|nr:GFA family protein [Pseudomonas sp.]MDE1198841.1 GFA family protein [Pseudomonas sp.]